MRTEDFFGYTAQVNPEPVAFDWDETPPKRRDLSGSDYIDMDAVTSAHTATPQPPVKARATRFGKRLTQFSYCLGASALVWFIGHMMLAHRTGDLDHHRAYHLEASSRALPIITFLVGVGAFVIKEKSTP